jgi:putative nucleotidyltransferase with HDIG domain
MTERFPDLGDHTAEVADLAGLTAGALGMNREEVEEVRRAAELHDIGKVAIPEMILEKAGPLDPQEWWEIRRHTLIGERIVAAAPALGRVAKIVRSTHERHAGGGYPDDRSSAARATSSTRRSSPRSCRCGGRPRPRRSLARASRPSGVRPARCARGRSGRG